jgi:hypothetical protein
VESGTGFTRCHIPEGNTIRNMYHYDNQIGHAASSANVVPSLPILVILMMEALRFCETNVGSYKSHTA